jgi:hypothetical protein
MKQWCGPIAVAAATVAGLAAALLGEHSGYRLFAWTALSAPLAVALFCWLRARLTASGRP